ncbi:MAG: hypothetical protein AABX71_02105 [Nanoarchaeota archaeon]
MELSDYLGYFREKGQVKIDFHNHCQTGSRLRKKPETFGEKVESIFFGEGFYNLGQLVKKVMDSDLDVLYITNFEDSRYEDWTSDKQIGGLGEGYEVARGKYYVFIKNKSGRVIALGKSQEVPTREGHLLYSGVEHGKRFKAGKSLEEYCREEDGELKTADHAYGFEGILRKNKNYAEKVDALERNGNFYFPLSFSNIRAYLSSKKHKKPLIANSDGHHPKDIGGTCNIFESSDLKYENEREFRDSINNAVRENKFKARFSIIPPWRILHHAFMIGLYMIKEMFSRSRKKLKGTFFTHV